ncbi:MAG: 4'-phosphopantetheinyl transferase superfamily protein [Bacteroidia bacterium]|nr:4'-phosphopantetheinyl transferase superfamily protein [Bacteroidia bacterium]
MPLIYQSEIKNKAVVGVWHIQEPISFFLEQLNENQVPDEKLESRKFEKLGTSYLLNVLAKRSIHHTVVYDTFGKPFLEDSADSVSFSHKKNHVAVMLANDKLLPGIDIETVCNLPVKLAPKFVSDNDIIPDGILTVDQKFTLIWAAKESLYKVYGRKELDFRKNMSVHFKSPNQLVGFVEKDAVTMQLQLRYEFINNLVLVHTL